MSFFKEPQLRKSSATIRDQLRQKRLAHEQAQKDAGVWGDMTVAEIMRENKVFMHYWKGNPVGDLLAPAGKRPREMTAGEHEAAVEAADDAASLRVSGRYADGTQTCGEASLDPDLITPEPLRSSPLLADG